MSAWKELVLKDIEELDLINYSKLNVIQQELADFLMNKGLSKMEVFLVLNGMQSKEMVNGKVARKYYKDNYRKILESEGVDI